MAARQPLPIEGTYMLLGEQQVASFVGQTGVTSFIHELAEEISAVYREPGVSGMDRSHIANVGGESGYATSEFMGCRADDYVVLKRIASDPDRAKENLPTVWGEMFCMETSEGSMRLMCGASFVTMMRTATTAALAVSRLQPNPETLSVVGAGFQGMTSALAVATMSPGLRTVLLRDIDASAANHKAKELQEIFRNQLGVERASGIRVEAVPADGDRLELESDVIVTATFGLPDRPPALSSSDLKPGVVIVALGADMVGKRELDPAIYEGAKFVSDELGQSLREGELQHAGKLLGASQDDVSRDRYGYVNFHGSLLGGRVIGLTELLEDTKHFSDRPEDITVYDSTGFAGQDLAAARVLLRLLKASDYPESLPFNGPPGIRGFADFAGFKRG